MKPSSQGENGVLAAERSAMGALPASVWALGFTSMFMDISSELVHSLLPVFMSTVLGAPVVAIGFVEGIAEATAAVTKMFSGALSDRLGNRKLLVVLGYGLGALSKPVFPLATTIGWVFAARFLDRISKGIRGAPRDALVADIAPAHLRGTAYGLRQSLDSVGAFVGPLLALLSMMWLMDDIKAVLWVAIAPAVVAVLLVGFFVHEPERARRASSEGAPLAFAAARQLERRYWVIVLLGSVFTLARFSEAFLVLRAQDVGLAIGYVPLVLIVMNVFYSAVAYPAGMASDRLGSRTLLIAGLAVLVASDLVLAIAASPLQAFAGAALWGPHMALTQGLLSKLVADSAPAQLRGTAFGVFNLVSGVAVLLASVIAGGLWSAFGASATFLAAAGFAALAAVGLFLLIGTKSESSGASK